MAGRFPRVSVQARLHALFVVSRARAHTQFFQYLECSVDTP